MPGPVVSIIIASIQSVAKVFVVGAAGFFAVQYPKKAPFLPAKAIGALARYSFNLLVIPLIYTTIAQSVTPSSLGTYWFVVVAAVVVTTIAFGAATFLYHIGSCCTLRTNNDSLQQQRQRHQDFNALRVSIAFPNIVALPILIFPSLCEYPVVYQQAVAAAAINTTVSDAASSVQECVTQSNAMIFCYFFIWTLLFYGVGYPFLLPPKAPRHEDQSKRKERIAASASFVAPTNSFLGRHDKENRSQTSQQSKENDDDLSDDVERQPTNNFPSDALSRDDLPLEQLPNSNIGDTNIVAEENQSQRRHDRYAFWKFVKDITWGSPGMMAMFLGFITACIPPLRHALFDAGGCLRFFGSALETLGQASTPVSTMVVAASLVALPNVPAVAPASTINDEDRVTAGSETGEHAEEVHLRERRLLRGPYAAEHTDNPSEYFESPVMSDPNFGPHQYQTRLPLPATPSRQDRLRRSQLLLTAALRRSSMRISTTLSTTPEMRRLHIWFIMTRLVVTPALVVACLWGLEWSGLLQSVPNLAKLVVVVNSALPGALIVVVILQASLPTNQGGATKRDRGEGVLEDADDDNNADEEERGLSQVQTAAVVTKVYLSSYLLSIVTISSWTALGLWIILPNRTS